jgi:CheY-like chemotaxis protein
MKTILVVEDEPSIAQIASDYLRHGGFGVITASNGVDALAQARTQRPISSCSILACRASTASRLPERFDARVTSRSSC